MKGVVPASTSDFGDSIPRLGSDIVGVNPKFARHAGGIGIGIGDWDIGLNDHTKGICRVVTGRRTPFRLPCTMLVLWRYLGPSTASANCEDSWEW